MIFKKKYYALRKYAYQSAVAVVAHCIIIITSFVYSIHIRIFIRVAEALFMDTLRLSMRRTLPSTLFVHNPIPTNAPIEAPKSCWARTETVFNARRP